VLIHFQLEIGFQRQVPSHLFSKVASTESSRVQHFFGFTVNVVCLRTLRLDGTLAFRSLLLVHGTFLRLTRKTQRLKPMGKPYFSKDLEGKLWFTLIHMCIRSHSCGI